MHLNLKLIQRAFVDLFLSLLFLPKATHENPELIWNDEAREKVCSVVKELKDRSIVQVTLVDTIQQATLGNRIQTSNSSSVGNRKRPIFHNCFRLHSTLKPTEPRTFYVKPSPREHNR